MEELRLFGSRGERFVLNSGLAKQAERVLGLYESLDFGRLKDDMLLEAYCSCVLEGYSADYYRVQECVLRQDYSSENICTKAVLNCYNAYKSSSMWFDESWLLCTHNMLVEGLGGTKEYGGYRSIGGSDDSIKHCIDSLFNFEDSYSGNPLIKACILHFFIMYVEPFVSANGRLARLAAQRSAFDSGLYFLYKIPVSQFILNDYNGYSRVFNSSSLVGGDGRIVITDFVKYLLGIYERAFMSVHEASYSEIEVILRGLYGNIGDVSFSLGELSSILGIEEKVVGDVLEKMCEMKVLRKVEIEDIVRYKLGGL